MGFLELTALVVGGIEARALDDANLDAARRRAEERVMEILAFLGRVLPEELLEREALLVPALGIDSRTPDLPVW